MSMTDLHPTKLSPWAFVLSLAAHFFLIAPQLHFTALSFDEPKIIKASLVALPKLQPVMPSTSAKPVNPAKQKKGAPPPPVATHQPAMNTAGAENISPVAEPPPSSPSATSIAAGEASGIPAVAKEEPKPAPSAGTTPTPAQETKPIPHPSSVNVEIEFALYKGTNGLKVGRATHTWQITNDTYLIRNVIEATGIFAMIRSGQLVQTSQGKVTGSGLEPDVFSDQRGPMADNIFSSLFDRQHQTLTYGRASEMTTVALPPQTQDQLSFIYQFVLQAPFTGTVQFSMTNGRKVDTYAYQVIGEETLETGLGKLQTLHLSKVRQPNEDGAEAWLAKDHQYLPVKIRLTDRNGGVAEQIVTAIRAK
ncbi:MAG: DUF3108 domain-containing protein [Gammaproteobacteria bacterium]|nr:DUF3108 domain-containing protein [Gammaproteobacteria bacterium]